METVLCRAVGRYHLSNICNLNETPLPFEYLSGNSYNTIGAKTVWVKDSRSGWDKRQASLVQCVFGDGVNKILPLVIFHGKCANTKPFREKQRKYHPGIIVEFNDTAYMNDKLLLKYITLYLIPVLEGQPSLFALGLCVSCKTPAVLDALRAENIIPSLIPAGCTSLVQPLDVSVNKPLKELIRGLTDEAIRDYESVKDFEKWTVGDRQVLTTNCVGDAWYQFSIEKHELLQRAFWKIGLSLPIDGSADDQLHIKGFSNIEIGDWKQDLDCGSLHMELSHFADVDRTHDESEYIEFVAHGE